MKLNKKKLSKLALGILTGVLIYLAGDRFGGAQTIITSIEDAFRQDSVAVVDTVKVAP